MEINRRTDSETGRANDRLYQKIEETEKKGKRPVKIQQTRGQWIKSVLMMAILK